MAGVLQKMGNHSYDDVRLHVIDLTNTGPVRELPSTIGCSACGCSMFESAEDVMLYQPRIRWVAVGRSKDAKKLES